ncbi:MAG: hypothetical protein AAFP70_17175, partial [Calditrichota bacterium]
MHIRQFPQNAFVLIFLVLSLQLWAQPESLDNQLKTAYDNFNYQALDSLLADALVQPQQYSNTVQVAIYRYGAIRRVQEGDSEVARSYFRQMLDLDPAIELDPVTTSPKVLLVFQQAKLDYTAGIQERLNAIEKAMAFEKENRPWRSLVFPGWEQYRRGYKAKGITWAILGVATISGTVQSVLTTRSRFDTYIDETDRSLLEERYNSYNSAYKSQFYWGYALASIWFASHVDA